MTPPDSHQPRTPDGRYTHRTSAPHPGRLGDLAAQTEPPRPPDSDDPAASGLLGLPSIYERWARALNTPPEDLAKYARMPERRVRLSVAGNPNTPPDTLTALAADNNHWVRLSVANNPNTAPETLTALAADEDDDVREAAATNPNTPPAGRAAAGLLND